MAKSYTALQRQCNRVSEVLLHLTPPKPDDEFEALRHVALRDLGKVDEYIKGKVTGNES